MVLEMGDPIKILDLARQLILLSGRNEQEVPIEFVGLRPGEKLMEELRCSTESCSQTAHSKILVFNANSGPHDDAVRKIDSAIDLMRSETDEMQARRILQDIVPEYQVSSDVAGVGTPALPIR